jgi:hypothetical protein
MKIGASKFWLLGLIISNAATAIILAWVLRSGDVENRVFPHLDLRQKTHQNDSASNGTSKQTSLQQVYEIGRRMQMARMPNWAMHAVATTAVSREFGPRREALLGATDEKRFWEAPATGQIPIETIDALRTLSEEQVAATRDALKAFGVDDIVNDGKPTKGDDLVPLDKRIEYNALIADYSNLRTNISTSAGGLMLPEDQEMIALINKQHRAALERILTPTGLREYELHHSVTANTMRQQLKLFKPSEEEFRAIFEFRRAFDLAHDPVLAAAHPERLRERVAAENKLNLDIGTVLTTTRHAEYLNAVNPSLQTLNRIAARFKLSPEIPVRVIDIQKEVFAQARTITANKYISTKDKDPQFSSLRRETETRLEELLGRSAFRAYKHHEAGVWLQHIGTISRGN